MQNNWGIELQISYLFWLLWFWLCQSPLALQQIIISGLKMLKTSAHEDNPNSPGNISCTTRLWNIADIKQLSNPIGGGEETESQLRQKGRREDGFIDSRQSHIDQNEINRLHYVEGTFNFGRMAILPMALIYEGRTDPASIVAKLFFWIAPVQRQLILLQTCLGANNHHFSQYKIVFGTIVSS